MRHTARNLVLSAALLAAFGGSAVGYARLAPAVAAQSAATEVKIDNFSFEPREIKVSAGTKVTWVNADDVPHTVVSNDDKFKSKALDTDDRFSFTFTQPGTYEYYCSVHPKMTAKVTVQ
jgi:plastocyanin